MANCNTQQLNITCGTDVVLHDRLIFDGETFDPNLSVGIAANLVSSLGKRTALDVQVVDDELLISVPWVDGTLPGCYGLEVTGSCNSKKWATYADSLIRYTKATVPGESEVTVESDSYDITQEVGYYFSDSPISRVEATIDDEVGEPSVNVAYEHKVLSLAFHRILGDGILSIAQTETSDESDGVNVVTVTTVGGKVFTFQVRNGSKGDTVILGEGVEYTLYNGLGQNTDGAMTQKKVTDELDGINVTEDVIDFSELYSYYYYIYQNKWNNGVNVTFGKHLCTSPNTKYKVTAGANYMTRVIFLESWIIPVKNAAITPKSYIDIPANTTQVITVPNGCFHLYITDNSNASVSNMELPSYMAKIESDSIRETLEWAIDPSANNAISDVEVLAKYGYADCPNPHTLMSDSSLDDVASNGLMASEYIEIPQGSTEIRYKGLIPGYRVIKTNYIIEYAGLCITDNNHVTLWFSEESEGVVDLSNYPTAKYIRFCPAFVNLECSVEFVKRGGYGEIDKSNHGDEILKQYGCTVEGNVYDASNTVKYLSSKTPCQEDGIISLIWGKFRAGDCTFFIGHIDQNGYLVIRDSFTETVVLGINTLNVEQRGIEIHKGEYLLIGKSGAKTYFGAMEGSPSAFAINIEDHYTEFPVNVILSLSWCVKTHVRSSKEIEEEVDALSNEVSVLNEEVTELKNNKKYFVEDEVTGENYQIIVRNGVLSLRSAQYSKAVVLGNSITTHDITDIWWGEWGMAATKREYDMVHIIEEGLQAKDPNAEVLPVQMAPWERDFSLDLATLIGDNITAATDLVIIRLGTNVPAANVSGLEAALENLIDYVMSAAPSAKVVITGQFYPSAGREAACQTAAAAKGIDYIRIDQFGIAAYKEEVGHYVYGDDGEIHEINHSGAANHPSNKGMLALANTILNAIGYESVQKSYSLQEVTVGGVTGTMYVED